MKAKISATFVKNLEPQAKPFEVNDSEIAGFLLRVQPSGAMTYYVRYRDRQGKCKRYRLGQHGSLTTPAARDAAQVQLRRLATGTDIQEKKKSDRQQLQREKISSLVGFLDARYEDYCRVELKIGIQPVKVIRSQFANYLDMQLSEIDQWQIAKWRNEKIKTGVKLASVNRPIAYLKACMSRAVEWGVIEQNPLSKVKLKTEDDNAVVRYLSDMEERRLRKALDDRETRRTAERRRYNLWLTERQHAPLPEFTTGQFTDHLKPMVLLALNTGMRRGELFSLEWQDVCLTKKIITIRAVNAKSDRTRKIPLNAEALGLLLTWRNQSNSNQSGLVFPSPKSIDGEAPKRLDNIVKSWGKLIKDAAVQNFRFHDVRHTFASKLVMRGVDLNTVRELLGHADIKMTLRYSHLTPEHKAAAVGLLDK